jgi:Ca2+/H+ antiporter, TMEM165/GDT1 family
VNGLILALLAVLLAGLGARDQITLARLTLAQGPRPATLVLAIALACATSALAAWLSLTLAPMLNANARLFFAALALAFAGGESLLLSPGRKPEEPTRSLAALAVVLLAHQITDAARFLVFALALATAAPVPAALGGAIGGAILLALAWAAPERFAWPRLRLPRPLIGAGLLLLALYLGIEAMARA